MKKLLILLAIPMFSFAQNSKSWKDIATENYYNKNYDKAIEYYLQWLEADPNDDENWYNLACCFALVEDDENAIKSLDKAISLGWNSCQHMQNDTDLSALHQSDEFKELIGKCEKSIALEKIQNYEVKHAVMRSLGTYGVLLPENYNKEKEYPLVVWIHGHGSSEFDHAKYVKEFGIKNAIIIFPRAPYIEKTITEYNGKLGWSANQTDGIEKDETQYMQQGSLFVGWINNCLEDVKKNYKIDTSNCVVFGHSQGAAYSLAYAMTYPTKVKTAIAFAGGTSSKFNFTPQMMRGLVANNVQVELIHGVNDPIIKLEWTEKLLEDLAQKKVAVTLHKVEADHSFGGDGVVEELVLDILNKQF